MTHRRYALLPLALALICSGAAQVPSPTVDSYLKVKGPKVVLRHVRVIDGTGAPATADRDIFIADGKITNITAAGTLGCNDCGQEIDLTGRTVFPGIVGMHDHLYYIARPDADADRHSQPPLLVPQMTFSAPRMYLAAGVTTMRTTGSVETWTDLNLKREIEAYHPPGPVYWGGRSFSPPETE